MRAAFISYLLMGNASKKLSSLFGKRYVLSVSYDSYGKGQSGNAIALFAYRDEHPSVW